MGIAPNPLYPERVGQSYSQGQAPSIPGNKGPLRHEEGIATDTDVPSDFARGAFFDTMPQPGTLHYNNQEALTKHADETMKERAHVGSAAWVEAPTVLSDFVAGAGAGQTPPRYETVNNPGTIQARRSTAVVFD